MCSFTRPLWETEYQLRQSIGLIQPSFSYVINPKKVLSGNQLLFRRELNSCTWIYGPFLKWKGVGVMFVFGRWEFASRFLSHFREIYNGIRCGNITALFYWQLGFKLAKLYENKPQLWDCGVSAPSVNSLLLMPQHVYLWKEKWFNSTTEEVKHTKLYFSFYNKSFHLWCLMWYKQM